MGLIRKEDIHESLLSSISSSNPNLLINGNFKINQRRKTRYTNKYTVDRWLLYSLNSVLLDVLDNGVKVTIDSRGGWANLYTKFDYIDFKDLLGQTLTLTFKLLKPTTKISRIWASCMNGTNVHHYLNDTIDENISIISKTFTIDQLYSNGYIEFGIQIQGNDGDSIEVEWAKLEIGDHPTQFVPRPYGEELALCQRYYECSNHVVRGSICEGSLRLSFDIQYKHTKRIVPTVKVYGLNNEEGCLAGKIGSDSNFPVTIYQNGVDGFGCIDLASTKGKSFVAGEAFEMEKWEADAEIY